MKKTIKNIVVCLLIMFAVIESNGISVNAAESIKAEHEETNYALLLRKVELLQMDLG